MNTKELRVYDPRKYAHVFVGLTIENKLHKDVKAKHFCWKYRGFGLQDDAFPVLKMRGVDTIVIHTWKGYTLTSKVEDWKIHDDLGDGPQTFLEEAKMARSGDKHDDETLF